jgi:protoporphyrinogen oxidase
LAELDQITAREWFDEQKFAEIFYDTYNVAARGLFGANLDEISALSYIPEIGFDFEDVDPIENVEDLNNSPEIGADETYAYTFVTGITEVTKGLANELGDRIHLNSTVTRVEQQDDVYLVTYEDEQGDSETLTCDLVILAVPAPLALEIAGGLLSEEHKEIMQQIPYAPYLTLALFSEEPIFEDAFDLAMPDGYFFTDVYNSTWVQRFYTPGLSDNPGSVLGIYIAPSSYQERELIDLSDEEILERVFQDLEKVFPGVQDKVIGHDLQRFPYAYPVMTPGAYERLTRLHRINQGSVLLAGDYMIYPTFEAAAESGQLVSRNAKLELDQRKTEEGDLDG